MPRSNQFKTNFTAGELDPLLRARTDIRGYANGAEKVRNMLLLPQGGARRRPGLEFLEEIPRKISRITSGVTITAPNGGTTGNANDDNRASTLDTVNNVGTTNPYVVVHYDLGSPKLIKFADYLGLQILGATTTATDFRIQYSTDDVAWTTLQPSGPSSIVNDEGRTRRFRADVTARYWRIARVGSTNVTGTISVAEFNLWEETAELADVRMIPFEFSTEQRYLLLVTQRNIGVYLDGVRQADIRFDFAPDDLLRLNWAQSLDTLIIVHQDFQPVRILRRGAHDDWDPSLLNYRTLQRFNFGDDNSPTPVAEVQDVTFTAFNANDQYQIDLDGIASEIQFYTGTAALDRERLERALKNHPLVDGEGVSVAHTGGTTFRVTFSGIDADAWPLLIGDTLLGTGTIGVTRIATGVSQKEDVWSDTRGWPKSVTFHQQRLWHGGSRARPQTIWGSKIALFFDFEVEENLDDEAIDVTLDTDSVAEILQIHSAQHLQIFTTSGEFFIPDEPITPNAIRVVRSTQHGIEPGTDVFDDDGVTLFVQARGKAIREWSYSAIEERYSGANVSLLSTHLIRNPVSTSYRRGTSTEDASYLLVVNTDGTLAVFTTLRDQEVAGWSLAYVRGSFIATGVDGEKMYFAVERTVDGTTRRYLERFDTARALDSSLRITAGLPTDTFTGLDHLEGETLKVIADGHLLTDVVVASGSVTIERDAEEYVELGLPFAPDGDVDFELITLPVEVQGEEGVSLIGEKKRIASVTLRLHESQGGIVARPNGTAGVRIPYQSFGSMLLDQPVQPFTGDKKIVGFLGWDLHGQVRVYETLPLPTTILGLAHEVQV